MRRWPWYQWAFVALTVLYTTPAWVVRFVPTTDGPCHLYNAWILRHMADAAHYPAVSYFEIVRQPLPNWLTHLLLAGLMWLVPPLVAEKLLISGYVLLLMGGLWYVAGAVDPDRRWLAFIGFLFVFSGPMQGGFYNFCYSIGLFLIVVGYWWRRRDTFDLGAAVRLNLLLALCYFAHLVSTVAALVAIAVLWLATLRRANVKRRLLQVAALSPQLVLPLWFLSAEGSASHPSSAALADLWAGFVHFNSFLGLAVQGPFAVALEAIFALLLAIAIGSRGSAWWRRPRSSGSGADLGFLLLAAAFTALYFVAPESMAGGSGIKMRLAFYPWLVLIPWLPALRGAARAAGVAALAAIALLNLGGVLRAYVQADSQLQRFLGGLDEVATDTVFVALVFPRANGCASPCYLAHASGYAATAKRLVDWDDYEAVTGIFPLRFREFARHDTLLLEARPQQVEPRELSTQVDYVYAWRAPLDAPSARLLRRDLTLVADRGDSQLFRSLRSRP